MRKLFLKPVLSLLALSALAVPVIAQHQLADRPTLRKAIDLRAHVVQPSAAAIQALEERVAAAPATEVPKGPDVTDLPAKPVAELIPETEKGKLYHVELTADQEKLVVAQLAGQKSIQAQGSALVPLPDVYRQLAADGTELLLKPFVIPQRLRLDSATGLFVGAIKVGVQEIGGPAPRKTLSAPIPFQVLQPDIATPEQLDVEKSGLPLGTIRIATDNIANGLIVTVASPFNPEGVPFAMPLAPTFGIGVTKSIDGFGLEEAPVLIRTSGLLNPKGRRVFVTVDGPARAKSQSLQLDEEGQANTTIRSTSNGEATVTASLDGFRDVEAKVKVAIPWVTLVATLLGGFLGGLARLLPDSGRQSSSALLYSLIVAIIVGILVFALYAVGVRVLPFRPSVEIGATFVFIVAAMGAYLGSRILPGGSQPVPRSGKTNSPEKSERNTRARHNVGESLTDTGSDEEESAGRSDASGERKPPDKE
jgi:hypothetical protein